VIQFVAATLNVNTRESDICARYGGEEFTILSPTGIEQATKLSEKIRNRIEASDIKTSDFEIKVTVSVGVSTFLATDNTFSDLVQRADKALYDAKSLGRNRIASNTSL
jgi:two-component system cell cycle response regulator